MLRNSVGVTPKMARAGVANFECNLDEASRGFTDELLCAGNPFSLHKLQWGHSGCLLKHTAKVEGAQFHQLGRCLDGDILSEALAHIILHFAELPNR
jgi:hypothetical protein